MRRGVAVALALTPLVAALGLRAATDPAVTLGLFDLVPEPLVRATREVGAAVASVPAALRDALSGSPAPSVELMSDDGPARDAIEDALRRGGRARDADEVAAALGYVPVPDPGANDPGVRVYAERELVRLMGAVERTRSMSWYTNPARGIEAVRRAIALPDFDPERHGKAMLRAAVDAGDAASVAPLLDAGVDTDLIDGDGRTPLMRAIEGGHGRMIAALLAASDPRVSGTCDDFRSRRRDTAPERCDAIELARRVRPDDAALHARLRERAAALTDPAERSAASARATLERVRALRGAGDVAAAHDAVGTALEALDPGSLDALSDADAVEAAMSLLLARHELATLLGAPFDAREGLEHLIGLGAWTGPAHALLDAVAEGLRTGSTAPLETWKGEHGADGPDHDLRLFRGELRGLADPVAAELARALPTGR